MLPFCGYHMGDYFNHWLKMGREIKNPPRIFCVNWFRKDADGKFLWPGFGENMRILKWIFDRVEGKGRSCHSALGFMPFYEDIEWSGLDFSREDFRELMSVDRETWLRELLDHEAFFMKLYHSLPKEFELIRELLVARLWRSSVETECP
jgi:phosphoenolpyruvate carboxykinase (GTP)